MSKWAITKLLLLLLINATFSQQLMTDAAIRPAIGFDWWIESHFPIAIETNQHSITNNCFNDTLSQIAALRAGRPWAVESIKIIHCQTILKLRLINFAIFAISVRIFGIFDG